MKSRFLSCYGFEPTDLNTQENFNMNYHNKYKYSPIETVKDIREFEYKVKTYERCPYEPNMIKKYDCSWSRACDYCPEHNHTTFKDNPKLLIKLIKFETEKASEEVEEESSIIDFDFSSPLFRLQVIKKLTEEYLNEL